MAESPPVPGMISVPEAWLRKHHVPQVSQHAAMDLETWPPDMSVVSRRGERRPAVFPCIAYVLSSIIPAVFSHGRHS